MLKRAVGTRLPTPFGELEIFAYESEEPLNHLALVKSPELLSQSSPLVRIHSECLTGDIFGSLRCDCGPQLNLALEFISQEECGILLYLRQEGRGIGLINKLHAYNLQDQGMDTVDANLHLGFDADQRDFNAAIEILKDLGVSSIRLLTNNPSKISVFDNTGIDVVERVALQIPPNHENIEYLKTKRDRMEHLLDL